MKSLARMNAAGTSPENGCYRSHCVHHLELMMSLIRAILSKIHIMTSKTEFLFRPTESVYEVSASNTKQHESKTQRLRCPVRTLGLNYPQLTGLLKHTWQEFDTLSDIE